VVPEKRKLMVVGAAIAAAFALTGCAPAGYNAADYQGGGAAEPAANAVDATADPEAEEELAAEDDDAADKEKAEEKDAAPKLDEEEITTELTVKSVKRMGKAVVDQDGFVLYRFDDDKIQPEVKSTCVGDCARVWPPALTEDGEPQLEGVDPDDVGTVTRADGTKQLTIGDWPVYRYIGDKAPGKWTGQNVGGKWFVVNPDGTKNLTCLPKISKPVAPPAEEESGAEEGSGGSDYSY
jgi:predicted lipoprotein with Yx(FWY)xxD motif